MDINIQDNSIYEKMLRRVRAEPSVKNPVFSPVEILLCEVLNEHRQEISRLKRRIHLLESRGDDA